MMIPNWVIIVAAIELTSFLIFGLSLATAIPEEEIAVAPTPPSSRKLVLVPAP